MEERKKVRFPIPVLLLFLLHFPPAVAGFAKVPGMVDAALHQYAPAQGAVYLFAFLAGWLLHFFALAVLLLPWKKGWYICAGLYLVMAVLAAVRMLDSPLDWLLRFGLLVYPSTRKYFGFEEPA